MKHTLFLILALLFVQSSIGQSKAQIDSINQIKVQKIDIPVNELIELFKQNIQDAEALNYVEGQAEAYLNLSIVYTYEGENQDKSIEAVLDAIRIYEKLDNKKEIAKTYGALGWRIKRRDLEKGIKYMQKGISIAEDISYKDELKNLYNNYGVLKQWNKEIDSAVYYFKAGLEIKKEQNDEFGIPYSLSNLAGAYLAKENYDQAILLLKESIDLRLQLKDSIGLGENYTQLAEVYYANQQIDTALKLFKESSEIARLKEYKQLEQFAYDYISKIYKQKNKADSALYYYKKHIDIKDQMFTEKQEAKISELNIAYETEKKEFAIAESKIKIQRKNLLLYLSLSGVLLLGLIGYLIYIQQRTKNKKLKKEMELKTALAKIETQNKLEEQRLRISRDLHDNIGSQLTFVISSLQYIQYQKKLNIDDIKSRVNDIGNFTQQTIHELRDTIWAMNKEKIVLSDLLSRMKNFINQLNIKENISVEVSESLEKEIENIVFSALNGIHIYRMIQESINNAIKHAKAKDIEIDLKYNNQKLEITIQDNGIGFDVTKAQTSNGLKNLQKRADRLKANLTINGEIGKGTSIKFSFIININEQILSLKESSLE
jgi:signal transduction histidine kinase